MELRKKARSQQAPATEHIQNVILRAFKSANPDLNDKPDHGISGEGPWVKDPPTIQAIKPRQ